ncbi:hypothetical protein Tco_0272819 [Tanacetum coccineum]
MSHTSSNKEFSKESFRKQTTLLEKRMDESIPWDQKCKSSKELFKIKKSVDTIFDGVERCKQTIAKRTYFGNIDPFIQNTIEGNFGPQISRLNADLENFHLCLNEEMVADLRYFNSLEHEVDTLKSQLETQKTQFLNEIDRLSREYYYADHMNAILGVYTDLDEFTNLQCDYVETWEKCEHLEKELSKSRTTSKNFEALQKHAINLELDLQQCKEKIKNDKSFKENQSNVFLKEREQYFEIQDLKAQLQDKGIAISELKKLIEKLKGKSVETKFEKSSVIRQPNAFKSQRQSILDFRSDVFAIVKNTTVIAPGLYKATQKPNQTRTPQLHQDIRKTNKRVPFSTGVIPNTSVSRPQLKSNHLEDRVMSNNSQGKKQEVEDHLRKFKTRQPMAVPVSTRQPKNNVNQSVATFRIRHESRLRETPEQNGCRNDRTVHFVEAASNNASAANVPITPVQEQGETSSRHVDSSNMHTFYQHHPSAQRWTKDHPLEQVIRNPSQSVRTRPVRWKQWRMCMFRTPPCMGISRQPRCKMSLTNSGSEKNKRVEKMTVIRNKSRLWDMGYAQKEDFPGGASGNFYYGLNRDTVVNMCINFLHGSDSEQRTHEFMHVYLAYASIVDFLEASHIRYALTVHPTIYVSHIQQFWSTARVETVDVETKIMDKVNGWKRTVTESSIRRHLKLLDDEGISTLLDNELFENLSLMGYNISPNQRFSFQKGQFSHQWKFLIHTIMQCLSPKSTGFNKFSSNIATAIVYRFFFKMGQFGVIKHTETYDVPFHTQKVFTTLRVNSPSFSGRTVQLFESMLVSQGEGSKNPTEPHHTPSAQYESTPHEDQTTSLELIPQATTLPSQSHPDISIPTSNIPIHRRLTKGTIQISQSKVPSPGADETASPSGDDRHREAFPTATSLDAGQDRENIAKTSAMPKKASPRVTSLGGGEGKAQVDQGGAKFQFMMIQVKEMMQDNDLKNSKSKDKGSKSRSQSMNEQSHYKQDKTINKAKHTLSRALSRSYLFIVHRGTEEFEERDLNIGGDFVFGLYRGITECNNQEKKDNVNAARTNEVNVVGENISIELPFDLTMPALEDDSIFEFSNYDKNDGEMADMNNLDTTI